eukprot:CAMPEP_0185031688 /NCGR_PEP_ID=MMETSP1103-20130426/19299_1 /TAXON_ID=36769 /ORGANISM="Paraphysomonas bandaiensis, Strain Caron Lab Isolate" /LENGTH=634 /DNA_ID=CAMNT_0027567301 /DNA_START=101 /DNA_END=2002 /DNA_ORIENTATION=+
MSSSSSNLLSKRRAPARPSIKSAIMSPSKSSSPISPPVSSSYTAHSSTSAASGAPKNPLHTTSSPNARPKGIIKLRPRRRLPSPFTLSKLPRRYRTSKCSLIDELSSPQPNICDLLYVLNTRSKSVGERNGDNYTPLHLACSNRSNLSMMNRVTFCRQLVEMYPKSVKHKDSDDQMPLHHAVQFTPSPCLRLVQCLLRADPQAASCRDKAGYLPLHLAVMGSASYTIIRMLVMAFPEGVNLPDGTGTTPVEYVQSRMKEPSDALLLLLSSNPKQSPVRDMCDPDPEEINAAVYLQQWWRELHPHARKSEPQPDSRMSRHSYRPPRKPHPKRAMPVETSMSSWRDDAAVMIQALYRGVSLRRRFNIGLSAVMIIQRVARGYVARRNLSEQASRDVSMRPNVRQKYSSPVGAVGGSWERPERSINLLEEEESGEEPGPSCVTSFSSTNSVTPEPPSPSVSSPEKVPEVSHDRVHTATVEKKPLGSVPIGLLVEVAIFLVLYGAAVLWLRTSNFFTSAIGEVCNEECTSGESERSRVFGGKWECWTAPHSHVGMVDLLLLTFFSTVASLFAVVVLILVVNISHRSSPVLSLIIGATRFTTVTLLSLTWVMYLVCADAYVDHVLDPLLAMIRGDGGIW